MMERYLKRKHDKTDDSQDDHASEASEVCKSSSTATAKWKHEYGENRKKGPGRELIMKWQSSFKWLRVEFDPDNRKPTLFCKWCERCKRNNIFTQGVY